MLECSVDFTGQRAVFASRLLSPHLDRPNKPFPAPGLTIAMEIRLVPRDEIDKVKYNSCVHYANNGNIFGYIWYLDFVAKEWDALVEGDYESVMPLPRREGLLGRPELFQPALMRELGIYSIHVLSPKRVRAFLEAIPASYKKVDLVVNEQVDAPDDLGFAVKNEVNHQLLLEPAYEELAEQYSRPLLLGLEKAEQAEVIPISNMKPEKLAAFYQKYTPAGGQREQNFHTLQRIMYNVLQRGMGFASGVQSRDKELLAVNFWMYSHHKVISLMPVESPAGAKVHALDYLFNMLIRTHAGRPMILDFNAASPAHFATRFGARENFFHRIRRNTKVLGLF